MPRGRGIEIDHFILAPLEKQKKSPSRDAEALTLLRRVTFDLIGMPPTVAEIEDFQRETANSENLPRRWNESSIACWLRRISASGGALLARCCPVF